MLFLHLQVLTDGTLLDLLFGLASATRGNHTLAGSNPGTAVLSRAGLVSMVTAALFVPVETTAYQPRQQMVSPQHTNHHHVTHNLDAHPRIRIGCIQLGCGSTRYYSRCSTDIYRWGSFFEGVLWERVQRNSQCTSLITVHHTVWDGGAQVALEGDVFEHRDSRTAFYNDLLVSATYTASTAVKRTQPSPIVQCIATLLHRPDDHLAPPWGCRPNNPLRCFSASTFMVGRA